MKNLSTTLLSRLTESVVESTIEKILVECSDTVDAYRAGYRKIYRGDPVLEKYPVAYFDPREHTRPARNTSSIFNTLIAADKRWAQRNIPYRHKSIVATTSYTYATGYGAVHVVFPVNGARIGVGTENDNWMNFSPGIKTVFASVESPFGRFLNISGVNEVFERAIMMVLDGKAAEAAAFETDPDRLMAILDEVDDAKYSTPNTNTPETVLLRFGLKKAAGVLTDPDLNHIDSTTVKGLRPSWMGDKEVWTDSPCYFVQKSHPFDTSDGANKMLKKLGITT